MGNMVVGRWAFGMTALQDGTVLGGNEGPPCDPEGGCTFYPQSSVEIFTPYDVN